MTASTKGILAMIGSCIIWGLSSLIYKQLSNVPAIEILAHRTLWSFVFFVILLGVQGRLYEVSGSFSDLRSTCLTVLAALMILANWFLFIWSIETERATQASLGYYISPLVIANIVIRKRNPPPSTAGLESSGKVMKKNCSSNQPNHT